MRRAAQAPGPALSSACFWSSSPQPPQPQVPETPWADEGGSVYHLTDEDFDQFVKEHSSVLVMFHAPCEWNFAPPPPHPPLSQSRMSVALCNVNPRSTYLLDARTRAKLGDAVVTGKVPTLIVHMAYPPLP